MLGSGVTPRWLAMALWSLALVLVGCPGDEAGASSATSGSSTSSGGATSSDGSSGSSSATSGASETSSTSGDSDSTGDAQPVCGDGVVARGEECDDGNSDPSDGCNAACVRDRLVFVTEEALTPGGFGSLFVADNICRKAAKDAGHPDFERFKAWLSDDVESPHNRFFHSPGRYVQVTGEVVAESWDDLTDGTLAHGIDRTITGLLLHERAVWTSTKPTGEAWDDSLDCANWTDSADESGRQGISGFVDARWTDDGVTLCIAGGRFYCFEQ